MTWNLAWWPVYMPSTIVLSIIKIASLQQKIQMDSEQPGKIRSKRAKIRLYEQKKLSFQAIFKFDPSFCSYWSHLHVEVLKRAFQWYITQVYTTISMIFQNFRRRNFAKLEYFKKWKKILLIWISQFWKQFWKGIKTTFPMIYDTWRFNKFMWSSETFCSLTDIWQKIGRFL